MHAPDPLAILIVTNAVITHTLSHVHGTFSWIMTLMAYFISNCSKGKNGYMTTDSTTSSTHHQRGQIGDESEHTASSITVEPHNCLSEACGRGMKVVCQLSALGVTMARGILTWGRSGISLPVLFSPLPWMRDATWDGHGSRSINNTPHHTLNVQCTLSWTPHTL